MMDNLNVFQVQIFGDLQKYNDVASVARCRIFYKKANRNGGYITDEFAEKLLKTIPYTPVKGIYSTDGEDYEDHGLKNSEGKIYGVVPKDCNFAWENHLDEDGVERTYATVDVILYTELYKEAKEITGKSQSMELYPPSIKGSWQYINGQKMFVYEEASFFGLQVLGDDVEPCFEGAAFYALRDSFKELIDKIDNYSIEDKQEEAHKMEFLKFKLSDDQKFDKIWEYVNPNCNEENDWIVDCFVMAVYEKYAVLYVCETGTYERLFYTKDDETDTITFGDRVECFMTDVTADELAALNTIQSLNGGSYELADNTFKKGLEFDEKISDFEHKISDLENEKSTLETEKQKSQEQFELSQATISELNATIESLSGEKADFQATINSLESYKHNIETREKEELLNKYSKKISQADQERFAENLEQYTVADLEKDLAFALVQNNSSSLFGMNEPDTGIIPKPKEDEWAGILGQHNK